MPIIVTAIDSRGYTSSATVNITVIAYKSIDITTAIMRRVNEIEDVTQVTLEEILHQLRLITSIKTRCESSIISIRGQTRALIAL